MNSRNQLCNELRRNFLKTLPQQLAKGARAISSWTDDKNSDNNSEPQIARLDITRCLAWEGASCQLCYLACPYRDRAIEMRDQKPVIISSVCDGCAMCEVACKTVNDLPVIRMVSLSVKEEK